MRLDAFSCDLRDGKNSSRKRASGFQVSGGWKLSLDIIAWTWQASTQTQWKFMLICGIVSSGTITRLGGRYAKETREIHS